MTWFRVESSADVYVVDPKGVPNPYWLVPGIPSAGPQKFGDGLLVKHDFIVIPSVVSRHSWNMIFDPVRAKGLFDLIEQEQSRSIPASTRQRQPNAARTDHCEAKPRGLQGAAKPKASPSLISPLHGFTD